jgi:outer membrane lipopolysaccharide assembly protein LptE/RlpB
LKPVAILCFTTLLLAGCGYHLGSGGPHVAGERWRVPVVLNNSREPFLEGRFTNELIDALLRRGARVVKTGEERRLRVVVEDFNTDPISLVNIDQVSEYRLRITVDVVVEDAAQRTVWKGNRLAFYDEFEAADDSQRQEDSRQAAIDRALNRFSDNLVSRLLVVSQGGPQPPSTAP